MFDLLKYFREFSSILLGISRDDKKSLYVGIATGIAQFEDLYLEIFFEDEDGDEDGGKISLKLFLGWERDLYPSPRGDSVLDKLH